MLLGTWKWALWAVAALTLAGSDVRPSGIDAHSHFHLGPGYKIGGVWYYPKEDWSYDQTGYASWYGKPFHGRRTADGEIFNLHALSAAHRTLPMPVVVRVTNLHNGRSVKLRVNDRGPFVAPDNRIIDVSRHAASVLGFERSGVAPVRVQIDVPASLKAVGAANRGSSLFTIPLPSLPSFAVSLPSFAIPELGLSRSAVIALVSALFGGFAFWVLVLDDGRRYRPNLTQRPLAIPPARVLPLEDQTRTAGLSERPLLPRF